MTYYFTLPKVDELTIDQNTVAYEKNAIAVAGAPGTGKSIVSLWRHIQGIDMGTRKSLLLTYTVTLELVLTSLAKTISKEAGEHISRTYWWLSHENERRDHYDEIIVDEAQDVGVEKYQQLKQYTEHISYGADDSQVLYPEHCSRKQELETLFPDAEQYTLYDNFRNTYEILIFVKSLFNDSFIPQQTLDSIEKHGEKPRLLITDKSNQNNIILETINEYYSLDAHNIGILVPFSDDVNRVYNMISSQGLECSSYSNKYGFKSTDNDSDLIESIHITTFKSSKGTEFDTVILPDFELITKSDTSEFIILKENDYYVALTRAKSNLYMISNKKILSNYSNTNTFDEVEV